MNQKQSSNPTNLLGRNIFAETFKQFTEETFLESLHQKVSNKPYFQKYKGFKNTILLMSYVFNAASILSASYAVFWITMRITGISWLGYILAAIFLLFLEKIKRKSSNEFFQCLFFHRKMAHGWLILSAFCLALSLFASAFGVKTGVENLSPDPNLFAMDSTATKYRTQIAALEQENKGLSSQKDHTGTIYYKLQSVIKTNKSMIANYNSRVLELDKKLENHNDELSLEYQEETELTAGIMAIIIIFMEILFECCIAYLWYFNFSLHFRSSIYADWIGFINLFVRFAVFSIKHKICGNLN